MTLDVDATISTDATPREAARSEGERELAVYIDELIAATLAMRSRRVSGADQGPLNASIAQLVNDGPEEGGDGPAEQAVRSEPADEPLQTGAVEQPGTEREATVPEHTASARSAAGAEQSPRESPPPPSERTAPPPARRRRGASSRISMSEELMALFRGTEHAVEQSSVISSRSSAANGVSSLRPADRQHSSPRPSVLLQRFLQQAVPPRERAPSGLPGLDANLGGGFGAGLHLLTGRPGAGKTAFLESVAWNAVSAEQPVLYYALKEGGMGAWQRMVSALGAILSGPTVPLDLLRSHSLGPPDVELVTRLDRVMQASVMPWLSLIEAVPASCTDTFSSFFADVRSRAQLVHERCGREPLLLIDDLDHLIFPLPDRSLPDILARLDSRLAVETLPAILTMTASDRPIWDPRGLPAHTVLAVARTSTTAEGSAHWVDLKILANSSTGWTGALPMLLDPCCGLFTEAAPAT